MKKKQRLMAIAGVFVLSYVMILLVVAFFFSKSAISEERMVSEGDSHTEQKEVKEITVVEKSAKVVDTSNNDTIEKEEEDNNQDNTEAVIEEAPDTEEVQEEVISYGDSGRLVIQDVGISVPLYYCGTDGDLHQYLVDNPDSACLFDYRSNGDLSLGISDHKYQGFDGLYDVVPGTIAKILHSNGTEETLICIYADRNAINDGYYIIDSQGRKVSYIDPSIIYMYTCNPEGWWSVTVTLWQYC